MTIYNEITCTQGLHKLKRKVPYGWDLNIYRGCEHGCKYCYAMGSHDYLEAEDFFKEIYIKSNLVDVLEKELKSKTWNREVINIGGVTDTYQPIEKKAQLMPEILKLLIKYKTPCIISTKSDLVLRDYDLIAALGKITYVNIAGTITTMDEKLRKKIEPRGVTSHKRFEMLKAFDKAEVSTGLHFMPIIPLLTDGYENVDAIYENAREAGVDYVLPGTLYLRGKFRSVFFEFMKKEFPEKFEAFREIYKTGGAEKGYKDQLYQMVNKLKRKYDLSSSYSKPMKEKLKRSQDEQLSFSL
ncbi:MAG: radical SAM protein [Eubacteriaceae bacterium]